MKNIVALCIISLLFLSMGSSANAVGAPQQPALKKPGVVTSTNIILYPQDANLRYAPGVIVEPRKPPYNLGGWRGNAYVIFPVQVPQAGTFTVSIVYSRNANHSATVQVVGTPTLSEQDMEHAPHFTASLPATGNNWSNYIRRDLGTLTLPQGKSYLMLSDWDEVTNQHLMNLREVHLIRK